MMREPCPSASTSGCLRAMRRPRERVELSMVPQPCDEAMFQDVYRIKAVLAVHGSNKLYVFQGVCVPC